MDVRLQFYRHVDTYRQILFHRWICIWRNFLGLSLLVHNHFLDCPMAFLCSCVSQRFCLWKFSLMFFFSVVGYATVPCTEFQIPNGIIVSTVRKNKCVVTCRDRWSGWWTQKHHHDQWKWSWMWIWSSWKSSLCNLVIYVVFIHPLIESSDQGSGSMYSASTIKSGSFISQLHNPIAAHIFALATTPTTYKFMVFSHVLRSHHPKLNYKSTTAPSPANVIVNGQTFALTLQSGE